MTAEADVTESGAHRALLQLRRRFVRDLLKPKKSGRSGQRIREKTEVSISSRFTKRFLRLVLGNDALQLAPHET